MSRVRLAVCVVSFGCVLAIACSSSSTSEPETSSRTTIGPAGGTVTSQDGIAALRIPEGALDAPVEITIAPAADAPAGLLVPAYAIEPSGTRFGKPAVLSLRTPSIVPTDTESPRVAIAENGAWRPVPEGAWVRGQHGVTARLEHLSTYGVVRGPNETPPPKCKCNPPDALECCTKSHGRLCAPCACEHGYTAATVDCWFGDSWVFLDCMTEKGDFIPTDHGTCALDCCRTLHGIALWSDGNDVACDYDGELDSFDKCVDGCPARSAPVCGTSDGAPTGCADTTGDGGATDGGGSSDGGADGGPCNATTCPNGCCSSNGTCMAPTGSACGTNGEACVDCGRGQMCNPKLSATTTFPKCCVSTTGACVDGEPCGDSAMMGRCYDGCCLLPP